MHNIYTRYGKYREKSNSVFININAIDILLDLIYRKYRYYQLKYRL